MRQAAAAAAAAERVGGEQQATEEEEARRGSKATSTVACYPGAIALEPWVAVQIALCFSTSRASAVCIPLERFRQELSSWVVCKSVVWFRGCEEVEMASLEVGWEREVCVWSVFCGQWRGLFSWSGLPEAERYGGMAKLGCDLQRPCKVWLAEQARAMDKVQGSSALGGETSGTTSTVRASRGDTALSVLGPWSSRCTLAWREEQGATRAQGLQHTIASVQAREGSSGTGQIPQSRNKQADHWALVASQTPLISSPQYLVRPLDPFCKWAVEWYAPDSGARPPFCCAALAVTSHRESLARQNRWDAASRSKADHKPTDCVRDGGS